MHRLVVLEMKGDHLAGSDDTQYKAEVLQFLTEHYLTHATESVGTLELVDHNQTVVQCELVLMSDWQIRLPGFFQWRLLSWKINKSKTPWMVAVKFNDKFRPKAVVQWESRHGFLEDFPKMKSK